MLHNDLAYDRTYSIVYLFFVLLPVDVFVHSVDY